jgi:large subunit ribosomal protein L25
MNESPVIQADYRTAVGKSAVRKLKHDGKIPAVVYGHQFSPIPLSLPAGLTAKMFRRGSEIVEDYKLCKLLIEGKPAVGPTMVVVKDIQRHPVTLVIEHIDFFAVRMDEKIIAPVQIRLLGKPEGVKLGGILRQILREVDVKSLPSNIPAHFEIDVSPLQLGDSLHVSDLPASDNVQILTDPQAAIVTVLAPTVTKDAAEDSAEGDSAAKPASAETETKA